MDMRQLTAAGLEAVEQLSCKHGFTTQGVLSMLDSVIAGNGHMAQFQHPDFGGSGQWMRGGMIMVSDMFNNALKARVDGLCTDLLGLLSSQPGLFTSGSFQAQSQGNAQVSLFVPGATDWWGADLGHPGSTGSQNNIRYAWFPQTRRLAVQLNGKVTLYDTLDHQIGGFSQQQSGGASMSFTSQRGLVELASLPVVSGEATTVAASVAAPTPAVVAHATRPSPAPSSGPGGATMDIFATLEKLAELHGKGIVTDEEFAAKKTELLSRL